MLQQLEPQQIRTNSKDKLNENDKKIYKDSLVLNLLQDEYASMPHNVQMTVTNCAPKFNCLKQRTKDFTYNSSVVVWDGSQRRGGVVFNSGEGYWVGYLNLCLFMLCRTQSLRQSSGKNKKIKKQDKFLYRLISLVLTSVETLASFFSILSQNTVLREGGNFNLP